MFWEIFLFEIKYRLKRPDSYLYFFTFFVLVTYAFATGSVPANDKTFVNAPIVLAKFFTIFSLFMMVITAAIMGAPLYRDLEYNTHEYYLSYPISKNGYFWGRFLGSFLFVFLTGSTLLWGSLLGSAIGPKLGWLSADRVMPIHLGAYLQPFFQFVLPNLLLTSSFFFGLVAYTRNSKVIYSGGVLFYLGYIMSVFASHFFANKNIAYFLDAFGFVPITLQEPYFSPEQLNHLQIPLHGMMLLNRLLWSGIGLLVIFLTWRLFSFNRFFNGRSNKKEKIKKVTDIQTTVRNIPRISAVFTGSYNRSTMFALIKVEWLSIIRDNYFRLILGAGTLFLAFLFWMGEGRHYDVPDLPRTSLLLGIYNENFIFYVFIILLFYTGETVHRERTTRFAIINDALPPSDAILYSSKLTALFFLAFLLATIPMIVGISIQLAKGFTLVNLPFYFISCYGLTLPMYLEMIMFSFAVHVLVNNKFAGHSLGLILFVLMLIAHATGRFDYRLLLYSYTPDYWITDMDGLGPSAAPQLWFNIYWLFAGGILVLVGALFYYRGMIADFRERIRLALHRFKGTPVKIAFVLLTGFLTSGFYNYYNVSYLNSWLTKSEKDSRAVAFEKQLKKYEDMPLPGIIKLRLYMDMYPEERRIVARSLVTIVNNNARPINTILLDGDNLTSYSIICNGRPMAFTQPLIYPWPKFTLFKKGMDTSMYRLYEFQQPLQPGDTALVEVNAELANKGFSNNFSGLSAQHNGTAFNAYLPGMGYDDDEELTQNSKRKEYGLPFRGEEMLPAPNDSSGVSRLASSTLSNLVDFEATLSTSADQIAIAPGSLDSTWKENNRSYFHYVLHNPKTYFPFPVLSARYSVIHDSVKLASGRTVDIEMDYHATHTSNLNRFLSVYKDGLNYFSHAFGEYPFHEMRLMEGPAFIRPGDFPNSIAYGEDYAWNAGFTNMDQFDYCYFLTAYHLGFQWWMFGVSPNHTQGAPCISEGLSKYGALMLCEKQLGKDNMRGILGSETWWYLFSHRYRYQKENPLLKATHDYVWNNKAGIVLYGLKDLIGEDTLNAALHEFHDSFSFRDKPPYAGGNDLLELLKKHVPDSLRYYLSDSWEKITFYDNKLIKAGFTPNGHNNEYTVHLEITARKVYADSTGKEKEASQMNDFIDIGIFAADSKNKDGRSVVNPLYMKKYKFSKGNHVMDIIVTGKPVRAGIDPYNKLIDQNREDNSKDLDK